VQTGAVPQLKLLLIYSTAKAKLNKQKGRYFRKLKIKQLCWSKYLISEKNLFSIKLEI